MRYTSGWPSRSGSVATVRYATNLDDLCAVLAQLVGNDLAADVGMRQQDLLAGEVACLGQRVDERFRAIFRRHHVELEAVLREPLGLAEPTPHSFA